jgi:type II secretory pathway component PulK
MSTSTEFFGRININTASQSVLATLKKAVSSLTDDQIATIVSKQPQVGDNLAIDDSYNTPAWLITQAQLPASLVKSLDKYITTRSEVYRMQVRGYFDDGGPEVRVEAVIDANGGQPRLLYRRDLTDLGKFNLQPQ